MKKTVSKTYLVEDVRMRKRLDSGIWYYRYKNPKTGYWKEESTGQINKTYAFECIKTILQPRVMAELLGAPDKTLLLKALFSKYFEANQGLRRESIKKMKSAQTNLKKWLGDEQFNEMRAIELDAIELLDELRYFACTNS